ncbi:HNH endonuclease [Klosneuvirus KNV1]|uniref:HNH endonuclease n=1 Tax=Klosneuvirus KNV1 TaxID=1977640 RepID=A0A1V0SI64_9VIRU|nr:HNH endonuclease [Klosneuvirus KNV1]
MGNNIKETETWKKLPDELKLSNYMISCKGRVYDLKKDRILDIDNHARYNGYVRLGITFDDNICKSVSLHFLVIHAFIGKGQPGQTIDHINRIRDDNRAVNLKWATPKEQSENREKPTEIKGKTIIQYDANKNIIREWDSISTASRTLKIHFNTIAKACKTNRISFCYFWQFKDDIPLENEIWNKIIVDEVPIKVSDQGRVQVSEIGKILDSSIAKEKEYARVKINKKRYRIHRLVCAAFKNFDLKSKLVVNHIDGNIKNNKLNNLEVITQKENVRHAHKIGLIPQKKQGYWRKVSRYDLDGNNEKIYESVQAAADDIGLKNSSHISETCKGIRKTCYEYLWKYKD